MHFKAVKNSTIHNSSKVAAGSLFIDSLMGRNSFCGYDCIIVNTSIGGFCSIASNCEIGGASHSIDWVSTSPVFNENREQISKKYAYHKYNTTQTTTIGHDVWIGARALIKAGVSIGTGAVVGMGSVVTKDIPPYEIWAGNPAKLIKKRFEEPIIEGLLNSKWWELDDCDLEKLAVHVRDVNSFLDAIKKLKG